MELFLNSGVYFIINTTNGHYYIGSSQSVDSRFNAHISMLKNNSHINIHLQNAVNKYRLDKFEFKIIEQVEPEKLLMKEQEYLDNANWSILYNMNWKVNTGGSDFTKKRVVLLDLDGFVVEEFASLKDTARYFGTENQINTLLNTGALYRNAYRIVSFDFYENHHDVITSWKNYSNEANNKELIQERIDAINHLSNHGVGIHSTYTSAEAEKFAFNAF